MLVSSSGQFRVTSYKKGLKNVFLKICVNVLLICINLQLSGKLTQVPGKIAQKTEMYMSLKPSNMISMQFLTMTVDLIIKFRVDPSSRN